MTKARQVFNIVATAQSERLGYEAALLAAYQVTCHIPFAEKPVEA